MPERDCVSVRGFKMSSLGNDLEDGKDFANKESFSGSERNKKNLDNMRDLSFKVPVKLFS